MIVNDDQSNWHFKNWMRFQAGIDEASAKKAWEACRAFYEGEVIKVLNLTRGITPDLIDKANQVLADQDQRPSNP